MAHTVAVYVPAGVNPFEAAVACEVFGIERPELGTAWYDFRLCAHNRVARTSTGMTWHTDFGIDELARADTIIIPVGRDNDPGRPEVVEALEAGHARGARIVTYCTGAFTLAETGLLDGRRATTHWMYAAEFRRRFPRVRLEPNVLFVDEGQILTSAGTAAGIDLSLHIVRSDHGAEAARVVAKRMVVPPYRDGGQAQFINPPHQPRIDANGLAGTLDWVLEHLHEELTIADMSEHALMSERTFARRFRETTGTTPFRWLTAQRLRYAQELLESTDLDVEQIAFRAGFGSSANLRDHFRRALGTAPSSYRRTFNCPDAPGRPDSAVYVEA